MDKKELRRQIRQLKKQLTAAQLTAQSEAIMQKLERHPDFLKAEVVMLYASLPDEVQTFDFIRKWAGRKKIILPTVVGEDIVPVAYDSKQAMAEGDFHIMEPQGRPYDGPIDMVIVPGMAFDRQGNRLGRGKGFYDRFLLRCPAAKKIGLCFAFQLLPSVPAEVFDQRVDEVLTAE